MPTPPVLYLFNLNRCWVRDRSRSGQAWSQGVNFINILLVAIGHADPKSAKKTDNLTVFFALLGSAPVRAACRMLMKLAPGHG